MASTATSCAATASAEPFWAQTFDASRAIAPSVSAGRHDRLRGLILLPARLSLLVVLASLGLGTAPTAAASQPVTSQHYVHVVCGAADHFFVRNKHRDARLGVELKHARTLGQTKGVLRAYLRDLVGYSKDLLGKLRDAGVPTVSNGSGTASSIESGYGGFERVFRAAYEQAGHLSTASARAFDSGKDRIARGINKSDSRISSRLDRVKSAPALDAAASHDSLCRALHRLSVAPPGSAIAVT